MISVETRDGRKGQGLGFGVGREMDETELEEGEACCYPDDDTSIDPDVALSYIVRVSLLCTCDEFDHFCFFCNIIYNGLS